MTTLRRVDCTRCGLPAVYEPADQMFADEGIMCIECLLFAEEEQAEKDMTKAQALVFIAFGSVYFVLLALFVDLFGEVIR